MVQISGKWHPKVCKCGYCAVLSAEVGLQSVLGKREGMLTTRELTSRAALEKGRKYSQRLKDGRIITVAVGKVSVPNIKNHTRAFWYIDGKRIARATAALILRNHS
jgi:hypothetical protein